MQTPTRIPQTPRQGRPTETFKGKGTVKPRRAFSELIDAKAASNLLGVPYTWLLAQAREHKIPHHRLGHYVRFDPEDLKTWLSEGRIPAESHPQCGVK